MKAIHRNILFFLVPLLAPLTASAETGRQSERTHATSEAAGSGTSWRASRVTGSDVENADGDTIGEAEDLVPDNKPGGVLAVIGSAGRFLGIAVTLRSFRDSIGGDVSVPDTSARNERRIIRGALTPVNQGHSAGDARITRAIRSYIMDTNLSFIAKDVNITTRDEHVTLNGVVESAAEHQAIIMIARIHADTDKITDELEVNSK